MKAGVALMKLPTCSVEIRKVWKGCLRIRTLSHLSRVERESLIAAPEPS